MLGKVYTSRQIRVGRPCPDPGEPHLWTNGLQGVHPLGCLPMSKRHLLADKLHLSTHRCLVLAAEPASDEPR